MRVEHDGKYCHAGTENAIFPSLPKCKEMENNIRSECDKLAGNPLELNPCPFCGATDIYYVFCYPWGAFSCNSCNADGPPIRMSEEESNFDDEIRMYEAKKLWNKRKDENG